MQTSGNQIGGEAEKWGQKDGKRQERKEQETTDEHGLDMGFGAFCLTIRVHQCSSVVIQVHRFCLSDYSVGYFAGDIG
jgi:hypothetical protein